MIMKRNLSFLLAVLLCLSLLPLNALADEPVPVGEIPVEEAALEVEEAPVLDGVGYVAVSEKNFPDAVFRAYVSKNCDTDGNGYLSEAEIAAVTTIDVSRNPSIWSQLGDPVASLQGIEYFTALTSLNCYFNQLTKLDMSKNTALTSLNCGSNQLAQLDVSKNTALTSLDCGSNRLTKLDVSRNTGLTSLICYYNWLTKLDVSKNIALTTISCYGNQLTKLDVSKNTALTNLECGENQLTKLDVSKNTALTTLSCWNNQLTKLDVSKNTALTTINCSNNQLTKLDVSKNTALTSLGCTGNQLTKLDVSNCPYLIEAAKRPNFIGRTEDFAWYDRYNYMGVAIVTFQFPLPMTLTYEGKKHEVEQTYFNLNLTGKADEIPLTNAKVTVADQTYTGKKLKPAPTVVLADETLKKGVDYTVSYKNNKAVGVGTVVIKGKGAYYGTLEVNFKIQGETPALESTAVVKNGVRLEWTNTGAAKYAVYRKASGGEWEELAVTSKTAYVDKTAEAGVKYAYKVSCAAKPKYDYEPTVLVGEFSKTKTVTVLAAPTLGSAENVKKGIRLEWTASDGAAKYAVYRKASGGEWEKLAATAKTAYLDKTAEAGVKYVYKVCCVAKDGNTITSADSNTLKITRKQ